MLTRTLGANPSNVLDRVGEYTGLFVTGVWRAGKTNSWIEVHDPASHDLIGRTADATDDDAVFAATNAADALAGWRKVSERERSEILARISQRIDECVVDLATLIVLESGKPLTEAISEVQTASKFFAGTAKRCCGSHASCW